MNPNDTVSVRYMVDDVAAAVDFYTSHFGFEVNTSSPAFADVVRGNLRLLLSGPQSSAGRPMPDGARPQPGGWNRIHLITDELDGEVARLKAEGVGTGGCCRLRGRWCRALPVRSSSLPEDETLSVLDRFAALMREVATADA